ncbi:Exosome complex component RRP45, partial [Brachionus plicatilis]
MPEAFAMARRFFDDVISSPVNIFLVGLICYFSYKLIKKDSTKPPAKKNSKSENDLANMPKQDFTLEQLKEYDGIKSNGRILIGVLGKVFDVSKAKDFYGPGGPYSVFAGRDASRALGTFSVDKSQFKDEYDDLSDLKTSQMESIKEWEMQFLEKYPLVGNLLRPGEEPSVYEEESAERMREVPLSLCEYDFVIKALSENLRLDKRSVYDIRDIKIDFLKTRGSCLLSIGNTQVSAQVSAEIVKPKDSRPNEGIIKINLDLSPMGAQHFEVGKQSEQGVELNRLLERNLKQSRFLDIETLCIRAGEKVWQIRVDLNVLNHDGNILDCANLAVICAVSHFRLPEVSVTGDQITIFSPEERNPIPLIIIHMPITLSFAFFDQGKFLLVDPTELEEKCMDGKLVIGMNRHREICTMQLSGNMLLLKDQIKRCVDITANKVLKITEFIQEEINKNVNDLEKKKSIRSSNLEEKMSM